MQGDSWVVLITGTVAGLVALVGYLLNQLANRRERKSKVYAEALEAVQEYAELPFRIRRRPSSDGVTRAELGGRISDIHAKLAFYGSWLYVDSVVVGMAYRYLVSQTAGRRYWSKAWAKPVLTQDVEASLVGQYRIDNQPEMDLCLKAMRCELSPWPFLFRRSILKDVETQRKERMTAKRPPVSRS
jgi:hypothetical protein